MIPAGSKLIVTQNTVTTSYQQSGEPSIYTNHQEIPLQLFKYEMHSGGTYWDTAGLANLTALIQYVKSKGIKIVNYRDGLRAKANLVDIGDYTNAKYIRFYRDGTHNLLG